MQKSLEGDQDETELITIRHKKWGRNERRKEEKERRESNPSMDSKGERI